MTTGIQNVSSALASGFCGNNGTEDRYGNVREDSNRLLVLLFYMIRDIVAALARRQQEPELELKCGGLHHDDD